MWCERAGDDLARVMMTSTVILAAVVAAVVVIVALLVWWFVAGTKSPGQITYDQATADNPARAMHDAEPLDELPTKGESK